MVGTSVSKTESMGLILVGDLIINIYARQLLHRRTGEEIFICFKHWQLLMFMATDLKRHFTQDELIDAVWSDRILNERVVGVTVHHLNQTLKKAGIMRNLIEGKRGVGYRITMLDGDGELFFASPDPDKRKIAISCN